MQDPLAIKMVSTMAPDARLELLQMMGTSMYPASFNAALGYLVTLRKMLPITKQDAMFVRLSGVSVGRACRRGEAPPCAHSRVCVVCAVCRRHHGRVHHRH